MENSQQLGTESIGKLLLKYSLPAIVGMLVSALYNVVDRIFIGQGVGTLAIAGLMLVFPIMMIVIAFGSMIGVGGTSLLSIYLGKKENDNAEKVLGNSITLIFIIGIVITILGYIFKTPILKMFGASDEVFRYASDYMNIILIGFIFQMVSLGLNNFIRAMGNPKKAMVTMLIGAGLNIILDPIFIFVFDMGVEGAALATTISQFVSAIWVFSYFLKSNNSVKVRKDNLYLKRNVVVKILKLGSASFAIQIAASAISFIYNLSLNHYGSDIDITTYGVISSVMMFTLMPIFGINQGAQPIIGYNYGAKSYSRVKTTLKYAAAMATVLVTLGFIAIRISPELIVKVFNASDPELITKGAKSLKIFTAMYPLIGFQIICSNYFQAIGKPKHALMLSTSRQVLFLIPLLLILPRIFGLYGIWAAAPTSDFIASVMTAFFIYKEMKSLPEDGMDIQTKTA